MTLDPYEINYQPANQAYDYPLIIKHLLDRARVVSAEQTISYADKFTYTYAEFFGRIARLANVLASLNLEEGDVIAVMDWDTHRYLECYFAIPMSKYILQTVNIRLSPDKVLYTINHAKPKVLLINAEFAPMINDYKHDVPSVEHVIWLDDNRFVSDVANATMPPIPMPTDCLGEYEALLKTASDAFEFPDFDENTIATTFYTSGTTGNPKGVFFSHRQLVLHTISETAALALNAGNKGLENGDVYMPMTPMFHVHAWGFPYAATMIGLKQVYPGRYIPSLMVDLIQQYRVNFTHCVPTILQMLMQEMASRGGRFEDLTMIIGGAKLTEGLARAAIAQGIEVFTGYGLSETCPILSITPFSRDDAYSSDDDVKRRVLTGVPIPFVAVSIVDGEGKSVAHDGKTAGEITVRTPWLTQSYYKNHDAGEALWENGWLHTQDIGNINAQGMIQITDRLKDVIKSGGEWISSLELETILSLHPSVADVAVIGIPDAKWDERPLALIVLKPQNLDTQAEDIVALAKQAAEKGFIPKYAIPHDVKFVTELPKTSVGKHDKKVMRQMYADGLFA